MAYMPTERVSVRELVLMVYCYEVEVYKRKYMRAYGVRVCVYLFVKRMATYECVFTFLENALLL